MSAADRIIWVLIVFGIWFWTALQVDRINLVLQNYGEVLCHMNAPMRGCQGEQK